MIFDDDGRQGGKFLRLTNRLTISANLWRENRSGKRGGIVTTPSIEASSL